VHWFHFFLATVFFTVGLAANLRVVAFFTGGLRLTGVSAKSATATEAIGLGLSSAAICLNIIYPPLYQVYQESYPIFEIFDL